MEQRRTTTRKTYYGIWKSFNKFFIKLDSKPDSWEDRIILFVGYLIDSKKKSSTVKSYISAIKAILLEDGVVLNENKYLLGSLTKACRLVNDHVKTRLPIRKGLLNIIVKSVKIHFGDAGQNYLANLYAAIFCSAYYGLLRVGEITTGTHPIRAVDVHIGENKDKILFILRTSKTHWKDSKPQSVKITGTMKCENIKRKEVCPFTALKHFLSIRPKCRSNNKSFFVFSDRTPVKPENMRRVLRETLTREGLKASLYDCHSFRSGMAVDLAARNIDVSVIQKLGRWSSNCVYTYLKY